MCFVKFGKHSLDLRRNNVLHKHINHDNLEAFGMRIVACHIKIILAFLEITQVL